MLRYEKGRTAKRLKFCEHNNKDGYTRPNEKHTYYNSLSRNDDIIVIFCLMSRITYDTARKNE